MDNMFLYKEKGRVELLSVLYFFCFRLRIVYLVIEMEKQKLDVCLLLFEEFEVICFKIVKGEFVFFVGE